MGKQKVVIIGIDGGEITVINEMIKCGLMPNMEKIIQHSTVRKMDCYIQGPGQGWASFMTGKSPVKHGIFHWKGYLGATSSDFKDRKIWNILGENGITCGVINLSYTFPPEPVKGFMISGLGGGLSATNDVVYSYPDSLIDELESHADGYIWGVKRIFGGPLDQKEYLQKLITMTRKRGEACLYLLNKNDPDFFMVVFRGADAIQHSFWHFLDPAYRISAKYKGLTAFIHQYYNILDKYVGKIWKRNHNAFKFIISDHGFGPTEAIFCINEYLANEGFLEKKKNVKSIIGNVCFMKVKNTLEPFYQKYFTRYKSLRNLNRLRKQKIDKIRVAIDWEQSAIYSRCPYGICFNRKLADTGEKQDAIFQDIKNQLLLIRDPETGNTIFKNLYRKEDLDIRTHEDAAPDMIFEIADESYFVLPDIFLDDDARVFQNIKSVDIGKVNGFHRRYGLLLTGGKAKCDASGLKDLNITDIHATVLKIFGVPIPDDIDGRPFCHISI